MSEPFEVACTRTEVTHSYQEIDIYLFRQSACASAVGFHNFIELIIVH